MSQFGDELKRLRGEQSLYHLEQCIGIDRSILRRYEMGQSPPAVEHIHKLADHFKVPYRGLRMLSFDRLIQDSEDREALIAWGLKELGLSSNDALSITDLSEADKTELLSLIINFIEVRKVQEEQDYAE